MRVITVLAGIWRFPLSAPAVNFTVGVSDSHLPPLYQSTGCKFCSTPSRIDKFSVSFSCVFLLWVGTLFFCVSFIFPLSQAFSRYKPYSHNSVPFLSSSVSLPPPPGSYDYPSVHTRTCAFDYIMTFLIAGVLSQMEGLYAKLYDKYTKLKVLIGSYVCIFREQS